MNTDQGFLHNPGICLKTPREIDIGIKGIEPEVFFKFYEELLLEIPKRIDRVNRSKGNLFNRLVGKEGMKLYG